jgi:signal transduction histidine kinase
LVSALGVLVATFLTFVLTRPIQQLVQATQAVAIGDFSQHVPRWADDEIGNLAGAFNAMTSQLARTDELRSEREQLRRQLLEKIITTQEEERKRIARELHDSASQSLTSLMLGLKMMETNCGDEQIARQVDELRQVAAHTLDEVHDLSIRLRPRILDDLGLNAALEQLVKEWQARTKTPVDCVIHTGVTRLPAEIETTLYRIVQEALTNISRHVGAQSVSVLLERRGDEVITIVEDDGRGFEASSITGDSHLGLAGMQERAELLGGSLTIESRPGVGTSLFVRLPLAPLEISA